MPRKERQNDNSCLMYLRGSTHVYIKIKYTNHANTFNLRATLTALYFVAFAHAENGNYKQLIIF